MEDNELKQLWQAYDRKLDQSLALNLQLLKEVQSRKARSVLRTLALRKLFVIALGVLWVLFLAGVATLAAKAGNPILLLCAAAIAGFNAYAIIGYMRHIIMIRQIDNNGRVSDTQERLAALELSVIQAPRILILQLPFWGFFSFTPGMMGDAVAWLVFVPLTLIFTIAAIWIYRKLGLQNRDKKWFVQFYGSEGLSSIHKATALLDEIKTFENAVL